MLDQVYAYSISDFYEIDLFWDWSRDSFVYCIGLLAVTTVLCGDTPVGGTVVGEFTRGDFFDTNISSSPVVQ